MSLGGRTREAKPRCSVANCIGRAPDAVVNQLTHTQSNGVTVRYRSGTFAFTARCADPLHYGHHQLRARGQESNQATAGLTDNPLQSVLIREDEVGEEGSSRCSSTELRAHKSFGALVWNRTSVSCSSNRRHHQIGYQGIVVAGVVPGHGHRRLFGFQRAPSLRNDFVRGRGLEPRRTGSKPVGLPLADPRLGVGQRGVEPRSLG
jgi:hypothetical protein